MRCAVWRCLRQLRSSSSSQLSMSGRVAVQRAHAAPRRGRLLRQVVHRKILVDGVAGNLELPGYLGDRVALHPQPAYRIRFGHADHSFLVSLVEYLSAMTKLADWGGRHVR